MRQIQQSAKASPAPDAWRKRRQCQDRLTDLLAQYGYQLLDTPILEPTELFLRQSGGALASQMYSFTDPGGQPVSLRPEFTAPIMRHYLEQASAQPADTPARYQYAGPVFRYSDGNGEGGRASGQFTQVGAELIGAPDQVGADAELLALAARVPAHLGIGDVVLELADMSVPHGLLDALGLSGRARSFIMGQVPSLRRGPAAAPGALARALELGLAGPDGGRDDDGLAAAIAGLDDTQARQVLRGLFRWQGSEASAPPSVGADLRVGPGRTPRSAPTGGSLARGGLGQRHPDEVVERLLRKLRGGDTPEQLSRGLELMAGLAALRGAPPQVVDQAHRLMAQAGAGAEGLDRLAELVGLLHQEPELRGRLVVDFGLVRELAYYNGIVFQATRPGPNVTGTAALGGGGRYDGLARALGGPDAVAVPALGFAYTLESLVALVA